MRIQGRHGDKWPADIGPGTPPWEPPRMCPRGPGERPRHPGTALPGTQAPMRAFYTYIHIYKYTGIQVYRYTGIVDESMIDEWMIDESMIDE